MEFVPEPAQTRLRNELHVAQEAGEGRYPPLLGSSSASAGRRRNTPSDSGPTPRNPRISSTTSGSTTSQPQTAWRRGRGPIRSIPPPEAMFLAVAPCGATARTPPTSGVGGQPSRLVRGAARTKSGGRASGLDRPPPQRTPRNGRSDVARGAWREPSRQAPSRGGRPRPWRRTSGGQRPSGGRRPRPPSSPWGARTPWTSGSRGGPAAEPDHLWIDPPLAERLERGVFFA
jgi:hypothetical protein